MTESELIEFFHSSLEGLTEEEVQKRQNQDGKNELPKKKRASFLKIVFRQLIDPIVLLLVVTAIFSFIIGEVVDALAIIFIILIDLIMGSLQEWNAEKNLALLANLIEMKIAVRRDGKEKSVNSNKLVPGNIIYLTSGDKVPADVRLLKTQNLTINESSLTGESVNVEKDSLPLSEKKTLIACNNMAFAGTIVVTGRGTAIVTKTGTETEIGKIATQVNQSKKTKSPLTLRMEKFSKQISLLIIIIGVIVTALLIYKQVPGNEIFLSVIALSVSAMPEGLPLALTMALTIASNRMAKKKVIVKRLNACESLGSCTMIASDKTGTLTVNEQTAKIIALPNNDQIPVEGVGYNDQGVIDFSKTKEIEKVKELIRLGAINNEAVFQKEEEHFTYHGDSIDIAFLVLKEKAKETLEKMTILEKIPYESENKFSATFYRIGNEIHCTVKGSFEKVYSFTKHEDYQNLSRQNENLAKDGYRVIALADGLVTEEKTKYTIEDIPSLKFLGMVGFIDPIRQEVIASLEECQNAGIKVVMITGDHPLTAYKIAQELKLVTDYDAVATQEEVEEYYAKGPEAFDNFVKNKKVFTRVTPLNKLAIVESFKRQGELVAVTGDGVNDAPALKSANIGVAMGSGTDVAKETASMIVMDDNFSSIAAGVKEGRIAYSNIRKVVYLLLSCGIAEVLFFILSILLDLPMPLVAIQLLWLNLVTDGLQDFALSFEKEEKGIMEEPPRSPREAIFNKELFKETVLSGTIIGLLVFGLWFYLINKVGMEVRLARGYTMILMVFLQNMHTLNCRSERNSIFKISCTSNPMILVSIGSAILLQIIVMEVPFLSAFLQTQSIPLIEIGELFLLSTLIVVIMEIYKLAKRHSK